MATVAEDVGLDDLFGTAASKVWAVSDPWAGLEYLSRREGVQLPERAPTSGDGAQEASDESLRYVRAVERAVEAGGFLSRNDTIEDVSTRALRFVLTPFLASLARQAWQGAPAGRLSALEEAHRETEDFFRRVDALGLLAVSDRDRVLGDAVDISETPTQKREARVARYRAERAASQKLEELLQRRFARAANGEDDEFDEEHERDAMLTILQSAVRRSLDAMSTLDQEIEILRYVAAAEARGADPRQEAERERSKVPPPPMNGMPSSFRVVDKREELHKGVFRPDHSVPTYTIEEWGEIEMKHAADVEQKKQQREFVRARAAAEEDSDGDDVSNREMMKARRWDNWKDDHNKGSGNSMR